MEKTKIPNTEENVSIRDAPSEKSILPSLAGVLTLVAIASCMGYAINSQQKNTEREEKERIESIAQEDSKWRDHFDMEFNESQKPIYATVIEERAGMHLINNDKTITEHTSPAYVIKLKTDNYLDHNTNSVQSKVIALNIVDGAGMTKETLEAIVTPGSRISFPRGNMLKGQGNEYYHIGSIERYGYGYGDGNWFRPETQGGTKLAGQVKVLSNTLEQE